jgi:hypothetical protein
MHHPNCGNATGRLQSSIADPIVGCGMVPATELLSPRPRGLVSAATPRVETTPAEEKKNHQDDDQDSQHVINLILNIAAYDDR